MRMKVNENRLTVSHTVLNGFYCSTNDQNEVGEKNGEQEKSECKRENRSNHQTIRTKRSEYQIHIWWYSNFLFQSFDVVIKERWF